MKKNEQKEMQITEQEMVQSEDLERTRERQCFIPKTDIYENEQGIVIVADLPGVNRDSVDITLDKEPVYFIGQGLAGVAINVAYGHFRTRSCEQTRSFGANTGSGTGNQCYFLCHVLSTAELINQRDMMVTPDKPGAP